MEGDLCRLPRLVPSTMKGWPGVCLKGRALWGPTQSSYKAVGAHCKIGWGGSHWRLEKRGGGIGVVDVPSGRVVGGALGGEGGAPLPSSKALGVAPRLLGSHSRASGLFLRSGCWLVGVRGWFVAKQRQMRWEGAKAVVWTPDTFATLALTDQCPMQTARPICGRWKRIPRRTGFLVTSPCSETCFYGRGWQPCGGDWAERGAEHAQASGGVLGRVSGVASGHQALHRAGIWQQGIGQCITLSIGHTYWALCVLLSTGQAPGTETAASTALGTRRDAA